MELNAIQLFFVGVAASLLMQFTRIAAAKYGKTLSKAQLGWLAFGVSFVLSVVFNWSQLTVLFANGLEDPAALVTGVTMLLSAVAGMATMIYNIILGKIMDKVGFEPTRFLPDKKVNPE